MKRIIAVALLLLYSFGYAQISQPTQPTIGPGGSNYSFGGVTQFDYGTNGSGSDFWLYEPNSPTPDSANVVVFIHGLGETNPKLYGAFIKHLVRKGNIVIYPRYQKDLNTSNTTFNDSCAKGILRALDTLQMTGHVKPRIQNFFLLGHSVGGILTANMTMLHAQYGLPKPLTAFSIQPGAATFLMSDYSPFPSDVRYLITASDDDFVVGTSPANTLFNQTVNVSTTQKNLVIQYADDHGSPTLGATHFEPLAGDAAFDNGETNLFIAASGSGPVNAYDFFCTWKLQDALMDCALSNQNCEYAFGDTPEQNGMGKWSDGTPVRILEITPGATTSLNHLESENGLFIYPNPNSGKFSIRYPDFQFKDNPVLFVFDITGKAVFQDEISNPESEILINDAERGLYFYTVKSENGELKTGKLVVE